ncbi:MULTISPECIES: inositol monophosphatase family protein [Mycolicibacterium]|uniref:Inositol-1-monophosphatase n=1 Tax=Mycolicibacterium phocaicum TaxID=319706 RepID=A0A7I7ZKB3_9MYCO|nr:MULTISPECIES: inositol monophosphatase family protein [Mycolicibacterium]TLH69485.1 inositol monophosphatase [Mycolicibacterium phocaicum]BBZ54239.1 inositol monophosphatase [Mycolicibacterium phocaicum]GCB01780.1 inositol monophosphatase [Mycolicibacterium sp. NCC-Tsukiji]
MTAREPESATAPAALRALAEQLATEAAAFVRRRRGEVFAGAPQGDGAVRTKSSPTDPVTVVDTETERLLRARLAVLRPDDAILGEEEGGAARAPAGVPVWVLDPIDGTVNFMYGLGAYAVSVGVQIDGVSVAGAVANAATGEVFSAARGQGAVVTRDGTRTALRCNVIDELPMALVATGFAYARERRRQQAGAVAELLAEVRDIRRVGSCALDLCMVAAGRLDAYFESGVHVWDWAAAALVAEEAGAVVRLPAPGADDDDLVIAAAPGVAAALTRQLARVGYR